MNTLFSLIAFLIMPVFVSDNSIAATSGQHDEPKIVHDYAAIRSINQLCTLFKGKPFYVDLWASWCEPCHEEFKYSNEVYTHLKEAGVEVVYISFDRDNQDSLWRADLYKYKLSGYHIRAGKPLLDSLTTLVWGAKDVYSIPHYLLFDKNGQVIDKAAPEPHTGKKLFDLIEEKLNNK